MHLLFEILFVIGNPGKISNGKSILQESLHYHILKTEGCQKLKYDEVRFQICRTFLRENRAKFFFDLNAVLLHISLVS